MSLGMKEVYWEIKINKPGPRFLPELSLSGPAKVVYFDLPIYFLHGHYSRLCVYQSQTSWLVCDWSKLIILSPDWFSLVQLSAKLLADLITLCIVNFKQQYNVVLNNTSSQYMRVKNMNVNFVIIKSQNQMKESSVKIKPPLPLGTP